MTTQSVDYKLNLIANNKEIRTLLSLSVSALCHDT